MSDERKRFYILYANGCMVRMDTLPASFPHMCDVGVIELAIDTEAGTAFDGKGGEDWRTHDQWTKVPEHVNA